METLSWNQKSVEGVLQSTFDLVTIQRKKEGEWRVFDGKDLWTWDKYIHIH